MKAESSERFRKALRYNIRASENDYKSGQKVFDYKGGRWRGPGVVIGEDHKVIFVKHGSFYYRVHPCHLMPVPEKDILIAPDDSGVSTDDGSVKNRDL
jgi:G:T-mismatch repair DNA endonuclease (very short patch repair protein)